MIGQKIIGVFLGYIIFLLGTILVFSLLDVTPDEMPKNLDLIVALFLGMVFSCGAGVVAMWLNSQRNYLPNWVLASLVAFIAVIGLAQDGSLWSQFAAILLFSPASFLGGYLTKRFVA